MRTGSESLKRVPRRMPRGGEGETQGGEKAKEERVAAAKRREEKNWVHEQTEKERKGSYARYHLCSGLQDAGFSNA